METPYLARRYAELAAGSPQQFGMAFFSPMLSVNFVHDSHVDIIHESPRCSTNKADQISPIQQIQNFEDFEPSVNLPVAQLVDLSDDDYHLSQSDYDYIMDGSKAGLNLCDSHFHSPLFLSPGGISFPVMSTAIAQVLSCRPSPVVPLMSFKLPLNDPSPCSHPARYRSWCPLMPAIDETVEATDEQLLHHDFQALSQRHCPSTCAQQLDGAWLWQPWARTERWTSPPCPGEMLEV